MKKYIFLAVLFSLIFASCGDERIINDTNDSWQVLAVVTTPNPELIKIEYPEGVVAESNIFEKANGFKLNSAPKLIAEFGNLLFLMMKDDYKIIVLDKKTFVQSAEIDYTSEQKKPIGLAFAPNGTAAYVIFDKDSVVDAIDLTTMQSAKRIRLKGIAVSIALSGNQVYLACPEINKIEIIDTRSNEIVNEIDVPEYPNLVTFTYDGLNAIVVSAGKGKFDTNEVKTEAYITMIDVGTAKESARQVLGIGIVNPKEQVPNALAVPSRLYAYIGTQEFFLRFNTRTMGSVARVSNGNYISVIYNYKRNEMIMIRDDDGIRNIITATPENYKVLFEKELPAGVTSILPL